MCPELTLPNLGTISIANIVATKAAGFFSSWSLALCLIMGSALCFLSLNVLMEKLGNDKILCMFALVVI